VVWEDADGYGVVVAKATRLSCPVAAYSGTENVSTGAPQQHCTVGNKRLSYVDGTEMASSRFYAMRRSSSRRREGEEGEAPRAAADDDASKGHGMAVGGSGNVDRRGAVL
jgi:hypothetical protein